MSWEQYFEGMTDADVISLNKSAHSAVNITDCYGSRDLRMLEASAAELEHRGYEYKEVTVIDWVKHPCP